MALLCPPCPPRAGKVMAQQWEGVFSIPLLETREIGWVFLLEKFRIKVVLTGRTEVSYHVPGTFSSHLATTYSG